MNIQQGCFSFRQNQHSGKGIHEFDDAVSAVESAEGILQEEGNTFVLVGVLQKTTS
jgi:dipeptidase E